MTDDLATALVKERESYRSHAYWDVNHWRVGYGSDTTTDANGGVHNVTRDTVTTRDDADRDLSRRIPAFQQHAAALIGQDAWNALPEGSRAALTSVAYNYGSLSHLPSVISAARSGNPQIISQAILNRADDNGGVNAQRRQQEAGVALGHPVPLGTIPDRGVAAAGNLANGANFASAGAPLPKPDLLAPPPLPRARPNPATVPFYQQMPRTADYGIQQRLVPGSKTAEPTDFQGLMPLGQPDARAQSLLAPFKQQFVSEDHPKSNAVPIPQPAVNRATAVPAMSVPNPAGIRSIEINPDGTPKVPGSIQTSSPLAGNVPMAAPRPPSIPAPPSTLQLLGQQPGIGPAAPATQQILNPAYTAALKAGQAYAAGGNIVTQAQQNAFGGLSAPPSVPLPRPRPLPPQYINVPVAPLRQMPVPLPQPRPTPPTQRGGLFGFLFPGTNQGAFNLMGQGLGGLLGGAAPVAPAVSTNSNDYMHSDAPIGMLAQQAGAGAQLPNSVVKSTRWQTGY